MDLSILNDTQLDCLTRIVDVIDDGYFDRLQLSSGDQKRVIKLLNKLIDMALKKKMLESKFLAEADTAKAYSMYLQFHTQIELINKYVLDIKKIIVPKEIKLIEKKDV
jgi:hypothetical protein